jgi:hypothetical protein
MRPKNKEIRVPNQISRAKTRENREVNKRKMLFSKGGIFQL